MSKKALVSVFDKVASLYSPLMTEVNPESAIRNFKIGAKQNQQINSCPEDYSLVLIGYIDDETGSIVSASENDQPVVLIQAKDLFPTE